MDGTNPDTVWTWNAIGKRSGAWSLDSSAPEARKGFLLNHLVGEKLADQVIEEESFSCLGCRGVKAPCAGTLADRIPRPHCIRIGAIHDLELAPDLAVGGDDGDPVAVISLYPDWCHP